MTSFGASMRKRAGARAADEMAAENAGEGDFYNGLTKSQIITIANKHNPDSTVKLQKTITAKFSHALPTGVLAVHIKNCWHLKFDLDDNLFPEEETIYFYMRVSNGAQFRDTVVKQAPAGTKCEDVAFDAIKHLSITISNNRFAPDNHVKLLLVAFVDKNKHIILAKKDLHIFDILKKPYQAESFELKRHDRILGVVEVELAFSYGHFGFGWSNQLKNPIKSPAVQIAHSMFYRQEPPKERALENVPDIATALPIGHPPFIPFTEKAEVGYNAKELGADIDVKALTKTINDPLVLASKTRKRLWALQKHYGELTSRKERLAFLRQLVNSRSEGEPVRRERRKVAQDDTQDEPDDPSVPLVPNVVCEPADPDEGDLDIITQIISTAPAVNPRNAEYQDQTDETEEVDTTKHVVAPSPGPEAPQAAAGGGGWGNVRKKFTNVLGALRFMSKSTAPPPGSDDSSPPKP